MNLAETVATLTGWLSEQGHADYMAALTTDPDTGSQYVAVTAPDGWTALFSQPDQLGWAQDQIRQHAAGL